MNQVKIKLLPGAQSPEYKTPGSAGFDLAVHSFKKLYTGKKEVDLTKELSHSIANGYINLRAHERVLVGTGMFVELPEGFELQIRSRSGLSLQKGLIVINQPGTIDSDYRGEVGVILYNTTPYLITVQVGDRVAQGIISQVYQPGFHITEELTDTQRGEGGFGSTGTK